MGRSRAVTSNNNFTGKSFYYKTSSHWNLTAYEISLKMLWASFPSLLVYVWNCCCQASGLNEMEKLGDESDHIQRLNYAYITNYVKIHIGLVLGPTNKCIL